MSRKEQFLDAMGALNDRTLEQVDARRREKKRQKRLYLRWAAAAACLCLAAAVILVLLSGRETVGENTLPEAAIREDTERHEQTAGPGRTSDTYQTLPELLAYLSDHDYHGDMAGDGKQTAQFSEASGEGTEVGEEKTAVTLQTEGGAWAYHVGRDAVYISRLEGARAVSVGHIEDPADCLFLWNTHLALVSTFQSGGNELDPEMSTRVTIWDLADPEEPVLLETYEQLGARGVCWTAGEKLYLTTEDGVCACGWSRLDDVSGYYPALTHNGEKVPWGDEDIDILGQPGQVRYTAVSVISMATGQLAEKQAFYGDINRIFYGPDWLALTVASLTETLRENPVVYTFDGSLTYTGKIVTAAAVDAPERNDQKDYVPQDGTYVDIISLSRRDGVYRMVGNCMVRQGEKNTSAFLAMTGDPATGETRAALLPSGEYPGETYPFATYTEILWEPDRAVICLGVMTDMQAQDLGMKTRFLFVTFAGMEAAFHENELTADYVAGTVGTYYGSPLGELFTLIPLDEGICLRYTDLGFGAGGFDVFDFSDSDAPEQLYRADTSLSGEGAFDFVSLIYDPRLYGAETIGVLRVTLGPEEYFRDVELSWCVFAVNPTADEPLVLLSEMPVEQVGTFFGAADLGIAVWEYGGSTYCVTRDMTAPVVCAAAGS